MDLGTYPAFRVLPCSVEPHPKDVNLIKFHVGVVPRVFADQEKYAMHLHPGISYALTRNLAFCSFNDR